MTLTGERVEQLFRAFAGRKVLVLGDLMLDTYLWGEVSRISPEAPVPVVEINRESFRFGGAANVMHNIASLGAAAVPVGVIGDDAGGSILKDLFAEYGFASDGLIVDAGRSTTVKTRIIANNQQVVRTDRETKEYISEDVSAGIRAFIEERITAIDAVIIEDYNKGLLSPGLISAVTEMAETHGVRVLVDPKFDNFFSYKNVTLFKPNRKEASDRLGMRLASAADAERAGAKLLEQLQCEAVLITLGEDGMVLCERDTGPVRIPTRAQKVHDVSGAGDTVISVMSVALSAGADYLEAAVIANYAAGIVCDEVGIVPVNKQTLYEKLLETGRSC